jgi:hypothetical protein
MRLGIMQPYFFPYAQQFRHIGQCDEWLVFDTVQFRRKSWMTRNRIADRNTEWSYVSVPMVKGASTGTIAAAELSVDDWRAALTDKLRVYEKAAPFYDEVIDLVADAVAPGVHTVSALNTQIIRTLCAALGITTPVRRVSDLGLALPDAADAAEWALLISAALGADVYSNAPGGRELFDPELYAARGVTLEFYEPKPLEHLTPGFVFTPGLSVIDSLMWVGTKALGTWART